MRTPTDTWHRAALAALPALLAGCAHIWVDAEGNTHVIGWAHHTRSPSSTRSAAETLRVRTLGLTWTRAEAGSAFVLGWGDTTLGFLRNDMCVAPDRAFEETTR